MLTQNIAPAAAVGNPGRNYPANIDAGTPTGWTRRLLSEARLVLDGGETVIRDGFEGLSPSLRIALGDLRTARLAGMHPPGFPDRECVARAVAETEARLSTLVSDLAPWPSAGGFRAHGAGMSLASAPAYDLAPVDVRLAKAFAETCAAFASGGPSSALHAFGAAVNAAGDLLRLPMSPVGERCAAVMTRAGIGEGRPSHAMTITCYGGKVPTGTLAFAFAGFEAALFRLVRDGAVGNGRQVPVMGAAAVAASRAMH